MKENFAGFQAHRKRGKSARASPTPHHTLNEERSARFTAQPLSALRWTVDFSARRLRLKSRGFVCQTKKVNSRGVIPERSVGQR